MIYSRVNRIWIIGEYSSGTEIIDIIGMRQITVDTMRFEVSWEGELISLDCEMLFRMVLPINWATSINAERAPDTMAMLFTSSISSSR